MILKGFCAELEIKEHINNVRINMNMNFVFIYYIYYVFLTILLLVNDSIL